LVLQIDCCVVGVNNVATEQRLWVWYWLCAEYSKGAVDSRTGTRTVIRVTTQKLLLHVQLHNKKAHLLYKTYSLQLNCTYSNYTEVAATYSTTQQHRNCPADVF